MRLPARLALAAAAGSVLIGSVVSAQTVPAAAAPVPHRPAATGPSAASGASGVHPPGAALENEVTGRLLWSRGLDTKRPIGSITKVMTALVVLHDGSLNREITVTQAAVAYARRNDGSSAGLHAGDQLTTQQLLEAMLLPSGCDAAYALASAYGPGLAAFVETMNATARQLGLGRTHFANADGLPVPTEHSTYSTPHDLLVIGRAAMAYPMFRAIVATHRIRAPPAPPPPAPTPHTHHRA